MLVYIAALHSRIHNLQMLYISMLYQYFDDLADWVREVGDRTGRLSADRVSRGIRALDT